MTPEILDNFVNEIISMYQKSDERINENNSMLKKED